MSYKALLDNRLPAASLNDRRNYNPYGPLEPWFDKTWKPGDLELVE
jgi:hypothetical protein